MSDEQLARVLWNETALAVFVLSDMATDCPRALLEIMNYAPIDGHCSVAVLPDPSATRSSLTAGMDLLINYAVDNFALQKVYIESTERVWNTVYEPIVGERRFCCEATLAEHDIERGARVAVQIYGWEVAVAERE